MKKTIYTIAFIALFSVISNAQSNSARPVEPVRAETVNPDGTTTTPAITPAPTDHVSQDNASKAETKPAGGTRMAITEKGVPASKKPAATENKKTEAPKTEKH